MRWCPVATSLRSETLRYLGYRGQELGDSLEERIDDALRHMRAVARPASVVRTFAIAAQNSDGVGLEGCALRLGGHDIVRHVDGAVEVALVAVTLGLAVDKELRRLSVVDPVGQVVSDAAATALIEHEVDTVEAQVHAAAAARGLFGGGRFSPGYGDLPLEIQPAFLAAVDAGRRLGITLTPSNLMVPTKSVTAIVGLFPTPRAESASPCATCSLAASCASRRDGATCRDSATRPPLEERHEGYGPAPHVV